MIAILLCAGFGTRMYPLTQDRPKALLPVAGKAVIDYLIEQLAEFPGLETIHLVSNGRFFPQFQAWAREWTAVLGSQGITLQLHNDGVLDNENRLGSNGDLAFVLNQIDLPDGALIAAGDNIFLFELGPVWDQFLQKRENLVLVVAQEDRQKLQRTGVAVLGKEDRLAQFFEKPKDPPSQWACLPCYFLNQSALHKVKAFVNDVDPPDAMGYLIGHLVDNETICAVKVAEGRLDIGNLADYETAEAILSAQAKDPQG
jgi:glucose-1-phosphate thymidylyltransferase